MQLVQATGGQSLRSIHSAPKSALAKVQRCCPPQPWSVVRATEQRRALRLAPPFLLDDYTPRFQLLSSVDAAKKRSQAYAHLRQCNLCPRKCNVNRLERSGYCLLQGNTVRVGTIAPHFGEEPCIQGHNGSGSVFFGGCSLRCVFCQNHDISHTRNGFELSPEELAEWMMKLQTFGKCHNINFVTAEVVVPQVVLAILAARDMGLTIPIIYNTSSYDSLESIELLDGLVDIYLPDFKFWTAASSRRLAKAEDYAVAAKESIKAMQRQVGDLCFTHDGIARRGVLVRHLVMPGLEAEGVEIMRWLAKEIGRDCAVHVMEQYHPRAHVGKPRRSGRAAERAKEAFADNVAGLGGISSAEILREGPDVRYEDINRPVSDGEVSVVKAAARAAGLWRFVEPAEHGGFNI